MASSGSMAFFEGGPLDGKYIVVDNDWHVFDVADVDRFGAGDEVGDVIPVRNGVYKEHYAATGRRLFVWDGWRDGQQPSANAD